jgi:ATP-dependent helicase/nuclease subunit A
LAFFYGFAASLGSATLMARRIGPLHSLQGDQARAADPRAHAALSASAGTGKTQVLTGRVLRLLIAGARPETILCLTFTKAAAAEMANRIGARLAAWVRMKDADLKKDLFALQERNDPATVKRARQLFARVLEAPGGLRIQTIHSFAQTLLAAFPAEAGISPGFQPLEGRAEQELVRATLANLLADAESAGDAQLLDDVRRLSLRLGEGPAIDYLKSCARAADALTEMAADRIEPRLRELLQLPDGSVEDFLASHCGDELFDCDLLRAIAAGNQAWGTSTGAAVVEKVERWLAMTPVERGAALPDLAGIVFTQKGDLKKVSAGQIKADPDYAAHAETLAEAIGELLAIQGGIRLVGDMAAGLRAGRAFAAAYGQAKRSAGLADFDDLIRWAQALLQQPGMGEWVRYKLDQRTDHILVDEAQDTNAAQWDIVRALTEEFFTGSSESEGRLRTLFMVGDFKQAIFGFQGTNPREFERMRVEVREKAAGASEDDRALEFRDLSINASFRSAQAVLDAVDAMVREVGFEAMGLPERPPLHLAHHSTRPGSVDLLKPFAADADAEAEAEENWLSDDVLRYADAIADQVKSWVDAAPLLDSTGRPLAPGDILILVRSRGELASLIVARLFLKRVPVAGIDRLFLSRPFAVRDLLSAVAFAVQPLDDLNLANLLVSPLIGWDQQQLYDLAHGRGKVRLWRALRDRAAERTDFAAAHEALAGLLAMADYTTPSRFLETLLSGPLDGRRKLYSRLGLSARDPIDELISAAFEFERSEIPSLDRFHAWFARGDVEIQRDPSERANVVRVMTVHGAKGLEAPYVLLADALGDPAKLGRSNPPLAIEVDAGKFPVIRPRKAEMVEPFAGIAELEEARDLQEHWRLLYVAMTRASERLILGGILPSRGIPENSWYQRIERALGGLGAKPVDDAIWGHAVRYSGAGRARAVKPRAARKPTAPIAVPDWARQAAPVEARPPRPLAPSAIAADDSAAPPPGPAMRAAAIRGTAIHHLLERLVEVAPGERRAAALAWLGRAGVIAEAQAREEIADQVCAVLSDPRFADLFGPGSLGEAPLAATLPDGRVIAGTVDRLLVEEDKVSVIDFKTGRVPDDAAAIPPSHLAQMAAYSEALAVIFPGRSVRASLLYTNGPRLFELDA